MCNAFFFLVRVSHFTFPQVIELGTRLLAAESLYVFLVHDSFEHAVSD